jgi:hypothetical protein
MAVISSASLILGLAAATPAAATPHTFGGAQLDDRLEAALRFSINPFAGSLTVTNNVLPRIEQDIDALLSVAPPKDLDNADIQFPARADEFERLGNDEP